MWIYDKQQVEALLDYPGCIAAMRDAMAALSRAGTAQPLRQIVPIGAGRLFGVMPGTLAEQTIFGAKMVSVFADPATGRSRHQGVVVVYDAGTGAVRCIADAEPVTLIRTACATAAATDALARPDATRLAIFGTGAQAESHLRALSGIRAWDEIVLWGRAFDRARDVAERVGHELGLPVTAVRDGREAASAADVICTVTAAAEPVLLGDWVCPGAHVNLVGSSHLGPVEIDSGLVAAGRYIADYRPGVVAQASELAVARDAGLVGDDHVVGEIGQVFLGGIPGRENDDQITIYKSLGHIVQDLAAVRYLAAQG